MLTSAPNAPSIPSTTRPPLLRDQQIHGPSDPLKPIEFDGADPSQGAKYTLSVPLDGSTVPTNNALSISTIVSTYAQLPTNCYFDYVDYQAALVSTGANTWAVGPPQTINSLLREANPDGGNFVVVQGVLTVHYKNALSRRRDAIIRAQRAVIAGAGVYPEKDLSSVYNLARAQPSPQTEPRSSQLTNQHSVLYIARSQCASAMYFLRPFLRRGNTGFYLRTLRALSTAAPEPAVNQANQQNHATSNNRVRLVEVGPRDGLQNEKTTIPLTTMIELIEKLAKTGLKDIEAGSFVAPKWVPQMADSNEILEYILKYPPTTLNPIAYSFLAPNAKGLEKALSILRDYPSAYSTFSSQNTSPYEPDESSPLPNESESDPNTKKPFVELSVFAAATESFTQKNLNCSIETSLERFKDVIQGGKAHGLRVRAYISVVLGCPFEGHDVDPKRVAEIACDLMEMGADEISLGDTTGMGTAPRTNELLRALQAAGIRKEDIAMHFHDTYGQALVNTAVSLEHGIRSFDSSVGGLGGCPYSPGATGNVSTEDMVYFMESLGMDTGVDLDAVVDIGEWITKEIGKPNSSSVGKAIVGRRQNE
ncbi:hypothetical protein G7Y89_g4638 [Cudoniella acicularis]|uniref:hydroxymethylglutaryl-CoA lyase n=1 Tax=Cudoniella acicularis TaxID=354080 RepID=A0A8H4W6I0_9HELO|nr:hypothetical protein G7Y89_g4638 [Cudoniella acicularis]